MELTLKLFRLYFSTLGAFAPRYAAKRAFHLFQRPRNLPFKPKEADFLDRAKTFSIEHEGSTVKCYEVGEPTGHLVFLVHGWDSNPGSLSGIADRLAQLGYRW